LLLLKIAFAVSLVVFIYSCVPPFSGYLAIFRIGYIAADLMNTGDYMMFETGTAVAELAKGAVLAAIAVSIFALHLLFTLKNSEWLKSRRLHRLDYYLSAVVVMSVLVLISTPFAYFRYNPWAHIIFVSVVLALFMLLWETTLVRLCAHTLGETTYFVQAFRVLPHGQVSGIFVIVVVVGASFLFLRNSFNYIYNMVKYVYLLDRNIDVWFADSNIFEQIVMPAVIAFICFGGCKLFTGLYELLGHAVGDKEAADRLRVDLIANVTHDIRTPLTSVINYVDLIDKLDIDNAELREYSAALKRASARMKLLVNDLLDASKAGTGNLPVEISDIDLAELLGQIAGDFDAAFAEKGLEYVSVSADSPQMSLKQPGESAAAPDEPALAGASEPSTTPVKAAAAPALVKADGAHLWRVLENVFSNVVNHAMPNTRVYVSIETKRVERRLRKTTKKIYGSDTEVILRVKNVSREPLNITPDELMEKFVRGDASRRSQGSGLGLSIAKDLVWLMNGGFEITIDGDLFTATITLPSAEVA
jgi:signal transduction histidine kinase